MKDMTDGSVHELYRLEALIILEQVITSVVEKKKNNLNEQNFVVYWKIRIEDRGSRNRESRIGQKELENKINK